VQADETGRVRTAFCQNGDWQSGRVGAVDTSVGQLLVGFRDNLLFQRDILKHRLDDDVRACKGLITVRWRDAAQQSVLLGFIHTATFDGFVRQLDGIAFAFFRILKAHVLERSWQAAAGVCPGDA